MKKSVIATIVAAVLIVAAVTVAVFFRPDLSLSDNAIFESEGFSVYADSIECGGDSYEAITPYAIVTTSTKEMVWTSEYVDSELIRYESSQRMVDALCNMSLERLHEIMDMVHKHSPESMFKTFDTDEIAYAVYMSLAWIDPAMSVKLLRSRVDDGMVNMHYGDRYAWPVWFDGLMWPVAALEVYKITGDREWLEEVYAVLKNTVDKIMPVIWNPSYSLVQGGVTPKRKVYPDWMQPKDVFESMSLAQNVRCVAVLDALNFIADELGYESDAVCVRRDSMIRAIYDYLWIPNMGYYSQYLYGGVYPLQSHVCDNIGQALSVLLGVSTLDMSASLIAKTPYMKNVSITETYPFKSIGKNYLNGPNAFLQGLWTMAAAKVSNSDVILAGMASMMKLAVENPFLSLDSLDMKDISNCFGIVSSMSMIPVRIIAGMDFCPDGIRFKPSVPLSLRETKCISDFRYRDMTLDVSVVGTGSVVESFSVDGIERDTCFIESTLKGRHSVNITLADDKSMRSGITMSDSVFIPETPVVSWDRNSEGRITNYVAGMEYGIYINSTFQDELTTASYRLVGATGYTLVDVVPILDNHWIGYMGRPYEYIPDGGVVEYRAIDATGGGTALIKNRRKAARFVELTVDYNRRVTFVVECETAGEYWIDLCYANGSGYALRQDKCAMRSLVVNGRQAGVFVMPQRGDGWWTVTGFSNMLCATLKSGRNLVSIEYRQGHNKNKDTKINTALVKYMRVIKK